MGCSCSARAGATYPRRQPAQDTTWDRGGGGGSVPVHRTTVDPLQWRPDVVLAGALATGVLPREFDVNGTLVNEGPRPDRPASPVADARAASPPPAAKAPDIIGPRRAGERRHSRSSGDAERGPIEALLGRPRPLVVSIDGDAGIGKSTLWTFANDVAAGCGDRVLAWRASGAERELAFGALIGLLDTDLGTAFDALLPPRRLALEAALGRSHATRLAPEPSACSASPFSTCSEPSRRPRRWPSPSTMPSGMARGRILAWDGELDAARTIAVESLARQEEAGDAWEAVIFCALLGFIELSVPDPPGALRYLTRANAHADTLGVGLPTVFRYLGDLVEAAVLAGDLVLAESTLVERLESPAERFPLPWVVEVAARGRGFLAAARGQLDDAIESFDRGLAVLDTTVMPFERGRTLFGRGQVQLRAGISSRARGPISRPPRRSSTIPTCLACPRISAFRQPPPPPAAGRR